MAVAPTYTNIHLMSLFSLLVGGEWLGDAHFLALGRARWDAWVAFTAGSGAPHEYNSPGYGAIDLSALAALHQYVRDPRVKLQARLFYERVWLHLALHFHRPTGLHAGPHCRCYWGDDDRWPGRPARPPLARDRAHLHARGRAAGARRPRRRRRASLPRSTWR